MSTLPHSLELVEKVHQKIAEQLEEAPLISCPTLKEKLGVDLQLKVESFQRGGSFKFRGALAFLKHLKESGYQNNVVAASDGNHARAVAWAAKSCGLPCQLFLPQTTEASVIEELKHLGATVQAEGFSLDDARTLAQERCRSDDLHYVSSGDNPISLAGIATSAIEILKAFGTDKKIGSLILPIGSGSLAVAVGGLLKRENPNLHVVGIQDETCCGGPPSNTTAELLDNIVDEVISLNTSSVDRAIAFLFKEHHLVVEHAAALPVAALLEEAVSLHGRHALAYVTGGNLRASQLQKVLEKI